jgi:hypothetical protein
MKKAGLDRKAGASAPRAKPEGRFAEAYRRSMKTRGMDGPIDLLVYRPVGFVVAWCLSRTGIGPNAITLLGALLGIAAGACALPGTSSAFLLCALLFQASNCLDCADGQLARLTGRFTEEGRILDGLSDYVVTLCIYLGSFAGLVQAGQGRLHALLLVAAGGAAHAFSDLYYDRVVTRYSALLSGKEPNAGREPEAASQAATAPRRILWKAYAFYAGLQEARRGKEVEPPYDALETEEAKKAYAERMYPMLLAWSFTGPSAHALYFLCFATLGRTELFFPASVFLAAATLVLLLVQQRMDLGLRTKEIA